jgi:hypothetical protein
MARSARASRIGEDQMRAFLRELEWRIAPLLPVAVARSIGALRGFFISRRSYAQNGEDLLAAQFFRRIGLSRGYYVDIGCFHPHWISNTKLLHDQGWSGLGVDVDPFKVRLYRLVRGSRVRTVCAAVTAVRSAEPARLYRFHKLWSELDTLSHEVATRSGRPFTVSTVQSLCIGDLLDLAPRPVNFLNIDVEGLDDSIVRAIDFGRHRPELVCFEDALGSILPGADIAGFLGAQGYVHLFSTGPSHGFARLA